jgi:hypothetical protein
MGVLLLLLLLLELWLLLVFVKLLVVCLEFLATCVVSLMWRMSGTIGAVRGAKKMGARDPAADGRNATTKVKAGGGRGATVDRGRSPRCGVGAVSRGAGKYFGGRYEPSTRRRGSASVGGGTSRVRVVDVDGPDG